MRAHASLTLGLGLALSLSGCDGCNAETTGGAGGGGSGGGAGQGGAAGAAGQGGAGGTGGALFGGQGGMAPCATDGTPCNGGTGVCAGGSCCEPALACGAACCTSPAVCSFGACLSPGADCVDAEDCAPGEYCETSLGAPPAPPQPGCIAALPTGKCLPKPPVCPNGQPPDPANPDCLAACQLIPPVIPFAPALTYAWGGQTAPPYATDVMMTPIVLELDDDDCDGAITARDIPELIFTTFTSGSYGGTGVLHAVSVEGGVTTELWSLSGIHPTKQLAGGELDGLPGNEIVACGNDGSLKLISAAGVELWSTPVPTCFMPSVANLDRLGGAEIVIESGIYDGATGALLHSFAVPLASSFVLSDVDSDGFQDIVTGSQVFHADGSLVADTGVANVGSFYGTQDWKSPWPAVGDLDLDGQPEVVVVDNLTHTLSVWRVDAMLPGGFEIVRGPVDLQGPNPPPACLVGTWGATHGGGPPTIADFTGDGIPDVATAGGVGYAVFDGAKLVDPMVPADQAIAWIFPTVDCSSASTGSTVFDFDGDGRAEVIYSDQQKLRIFDGPTGSVLFEVCNTTATLIENPVVADVDGDGHADIVAVANAYGYTSTPQLQCDDGSGGVPAQSGVRVFGDPTGKWVRTRRVWNEHAYHVTNVNEDGSIPVAEPPNWTVAGLNNFRQNKQPGSEFAAPDAVVSLTPSCEDGYALYATVRNLGEAALPAGVVVGFYQGQPPNGTLLGTGVTQLVLYPAQAEVVVFTPAASISGSLVYAVVDDGGAPHPNWAECRTDNNVSEPVASDCFVPN